MADNFNLSINGHIKILSLDSGNILFEQHNKIGSDALEIITRCMTQVDFSKSVDKIKAYGDFQAIEGDISFVNYIPSTNTLLFRTIFMEFDFDGTIDRLELRSSALNKVFAMKEGLNILKDSKTRIQIDWGITVTNC